MTALAFVVLPVTTAAARAIRSGWFPIGDSAQLFIRSRDVLTQHHPFLGSWSSASLALDENINNPGALHQYLIAPFAHFLPPGPATAVGLSFVNILMIIGIFMTSHRLGGWAFQRLALLATAALTWSMGSELLLSWVQSETLMLPFLLFLVLCAGLVSGDDALLPWTVAVASLILQTHVSYAYIVTAAAIGVIGVRVWRRPSSQWRRPAAYAAVTGAMLWVLPVWEQFFGPGKGNLSRLAGNASGTDFSLGVSGAVRMAGHAILLTPWWRREGYTPAVTGNTLANTPGGPILEIPNALPLAVATVGFVVLCSGLVVLTRAAIRRGLETQGVTGIIATVVLAGSILALSRQPVGVTGLAPHHVQWVWVLVTFVYLVLGWLALSVWRHGRDSALLRPDISVSDAIVLGLIVLVGLANVPYHVQPNGPLLGDRFMTAINGVRDDVAILRDHDPVVYDLSVSLPFEPYSAAMMMWFQNEGVEYRFVDNEIMIRQMGEGRRADGTETTRVFQVQGSAALDYRGSGCLIGRASGLAPDDDSRAARLVDEAADRLARETGRTSDEAFSAIVGREVDPFDAGERGLVDAWVETTFALYADGRVCVDL